MNADFPVYRDPETLEVHQVCPRCKAVLEVCLIGCDGHAFRVYRCRAHGDVVPVNSHVANPADRGEPLLGRS